MASVFRWYRGQISISAFYLIISDDSDSYEYDSFELDSHEDFGSDSSSDSEEDDSTGTNEGLKTYQKLFMTKLDKMATDEMANLLTDYYRVIEQSKSHRSDQVTKYDSVAKEHPTP